MAENTDPQRVLSEEILADARRQSERLIRRAKTDAEQIVAKAEAENEKEHRERIEAARAEAHRRSALVLATVGVEAGRMRIRRAEEVLQGIYNEARKRIERREGFDYRQTVVVLAAAAISRMEGNRFVLTISEADREALGAGLAEEVSRRVGRKGLDVTVNTEGAAAGGVIIRDAEGRQRWDNSLAGRLERFWPALRPEIGAAAWPLEAQRPEGKSGAPASTPGGAKELLC